MTVQKLNIQFVNKTKLPDDQVFITFQAPHKDLIATYADKKPVPRGKTNGKSNLMTNSISLQDITDTGLEIEKANSAVVFVSYAATDAVNGFNMSGDLSGNEQPSFIGEGGANYYEAYQPFELTYISNDKGSQGNLTNINYFCAPISIQSYSGGTSGKKLQCRGYFGGSAKGTRKITKKLLKLVKGPNIKLAMPTLDGHILRIIGPSSYGAQINPYPDFTGYLTWLNKNKIRTKIQNNNAFNAKTKSKSGYVNYNYRLEFEATVAADQTITLQGDIIVERAPNGKAPTTYKTYRNAKMTISPVFGPKTSETIFTNTIYGQADPEGVGKGSTVFNSVWENVYTDMINLGLSESDFTTTQNLAIGEITTGLLGGFLGSDLQYQNGMGIFSKYDGKPYKKVPSNAWWNTQALPAPAQLQPNAPFFDQYSSVIFDASNNEVYSIPYSDRFGDGPLIQSRFFNGENVDTWLITLGKPIFVVQ